MIKTILPYYQMHSLTINYQPWSIVKLKVNNVWKRTKGKGVKVAILDTGTIIHPAIKNIIIRKSFVKNEGVEDSEGHGTHVTGIIGAQKFGVAPECKIYSFKVLGKNGKGNLSWLKAALEECIKLEVDVVNMSLGWLKYDSKSIYSLIKMGYSKGIIYVAAAGNDGEKGVNYPACWKEVIAVAACNINNKIARFSSRGKAVEISAPGVKITSTYLNNMYATLSGTSMAAPFVTGVITLMLAKKRRSPKEIRELIQKKAIDIEIKGIDESSGYGLINPPLLAKRRGIDVTFA